MNNVFRLNLSLVLVALLLSSCQEEAGPIGDVIPQGEWTRTLALQGGKEKRSRIFLQRDSAFIADTIVSFAGGVPAVDSVHSIELELAVAGDGYFRGVEHHSVGGSDVISQELRYWYFYIKNDSLYFYRGMRLLGNRISLPGTWSMSSADSAFLGASYVYTFTNDQVTITRLAPGGTEANTYPYSAARDSLRISGSPLPFPGSRFEIVPGLALYITSHRETGYVQKRE